ncbi:MAG: RNA-binding protein [Nitrospirae bacterium]|nr:RNA-binding protein [Nitrospirota bacterium]
MNLFVGNLSFETTDQDLREAFGSFGQVSSATVITDRETGRSRGFGFVEMNADAEARAAIEGLNEKALHGRNLRVNEAQPREAGRSGGGGGAGGGGRGRGRF